MASRKNSSKSGSKTTATRRTAVPKKATSSILKQATKLVAKVETAPIAAVEQSNMPTHPVPSQHCLQLLGELLSSDMQARLTAAAALGRLNEAAAVPALVVALRDPSAEAASESASSLGLIGDRSAVEPLINVIKNQENFYHCVVRAAAAQSLGQLKDVTAVPALIDAIRDPMAEASAESIRALAALKDNRAIEPLIDVVNNHHGFFLPFVRRAAILALGTFNDGRATEALNEVAGNMIEDAVVRQSAIESLGSSR